MTRSKVPIEEREWSNETGLITGAMSNGDVISAGENRSRCSKNLPHCRFAYHVSNMECYDVYCGWIGLVHMRAFAFAG